MFLGIVWVLLLVVGVADPEVNSFKFHQIILILSGLACTVGLVLDMRVWSASVERWVGRSWFGRAVVVSVIAMSGAFSAAYASTLINMFSGVAVNPFPYTLAFLAVPATLALSVLIMAVIYMVLAFIVVGYALRDMPASMLFLSRSPVRIRRSRRVFYALARMLALGFVLSGLFAAGPWFEHGLIFSAKQFAVRFEMYPNDPCASPGERISRLSSDIVLVASLEKREVRFKRRHCPLDIGLR